MKNAFSLRFRKLLLPLSTIFIMFFCVFTANAQKLTGLEDKWEGRAELSLDDGNVMTMAFTFVFEREENVKVEFVGNISGYLPRSYYNPNTGKEEWRPTFVSITDFSGKVTGTYGKKDSSVHIDCPEFTIDATVDGGELAGVIALKKGNGKGTLKIGRIYPNTVRNANGTLRPADGYRWVNSKNPKDYRVERIP